MKKRYISPTIEATNMFSVMQPIASSSDPKSLEIIDDKTVEDKNEVWSKKFGGKLWEDM